MTSKQLLYTQIARNHSAFFLLRILREADSFVQTSDELLFNSSIPRPFRSSVTHAIHAWIVLARSPTHLAAFLLRLSFVLKAVERMLASKSSFPPTPVSLVFSTVPYDMAILLATRGNVIYSLKNYINSIT